MRPNTSVSPTRDNWNQKLWKGKVRRGQKGCHIQEIGEKLECEYIWTLQNNSPGKREILANIARAYLSDIDRHRGLKTGWMRLKYKESEDIGGEQYAFPDILPRHFSCHFKIWCHPFVQIHGLCYITLRLGKADTLVCWHNCFYRYMLTFFESRYTLHN